MGEHQPNSILLESITPPPQKKNKQQNNKPNLQKEQKIFVKEQLCHGWNMHLVIS